MSKRAVLVQACLNGSRRSEEHPALPLSPNAIARDASRVVAAGAASLHIHPRTADGAETLDASACAAVVNAIRDACPGIPVGLTTGLWIAPDPARRLALVESWDTPPDFVSVNLSEAGVEGLCALLQRRRIGIEAGVWTVDDARVLAELGVADQCLRVLIETRPRESAAAVTEARAIDEALDQAKVHVPRLHHGEGGATWAVIDAALDRGHDVRMGLEDTLQLPDGRPARDNLELVEAAIAMVWRKRLALQG